MSAARARREIGGFPARRFSAPIRVRERNPRRAKTRRNSQEKTLRAEFIPPSLKSAGASVRALTAKKKEKTAQAKLWGAQSGQRRRPR